MGCRGDSYALSARAARCCEFAKIRCESAAICRRAGNARPYIQYCVCGSKSSTIRMRAMTGQVRNVLPAAARRKTIFFLKMSNKRSDLIER